jgi:hypothetical protein
MSIRRADIAVAFATFKAAGCKPPTDHASDEGLDFALRVWTSVLADLEREQLLELVVAYVRTPGSKWWPTPGELLALRRDDDDDALEQWGRLLILLGKRGRANPPTRLGELAPTSTTWSLSDDAEVDAALHAGLQALGGWRRACAMSERDQTANRAAFRDAYRSARRRASHRLERQAVAAIAAGPVPLLGGST